MYQNVGVDFLRNKLALHQPGVSKRYRYYDMKMPDKWIIRDMPAEFRAFRTVIGWCAKAVNSLADRIVLRGFTEDNFDLLQIYQMNNMDILCDSAVLAALIGSCSFIYISPDESGFPRMRVLDAYNATGMIDQVTYMLHEGYAVLERDANGNPVTEAYFEKGRTTYYEKDKQPYSIDNVAPYPLLVPVIYRPDATRAFGHSRITRGCMDRTDAAIRTLKRAEIASEFYSYPQRYILGMDSGAETDEETPPPQFDKWAAAMSAFFKVDKDEDGDKPVVGQFPQQSMAPFMDEIRMQAGFFAGEADLTLDDLGFPSQAPTSPETVETYHNNLIATGCKAQRTFGTGFLNAGFLCACIRDNYSYLRQQIYLTKPDYEPLFKPDITRVGAIGDAIYKLQQSPEVIDEKKLKALINI